MLPSNTTIQNLVRSRFVSGEDIGFAIGMVTADEPEGEITYTGTIKSYTNQPLTLGDDTLFELASISKTFCAALFASFASTRPNLAGSMVTKYHPAGTVPLNQKFANMSLTSLANYTSGLPEDNHDPTDQPHPLRPPYTDVDMYQYLSTMTWTPGPAGKAFAYSNLGFALLGESLGPAIGTNDSFAQLLTANVLQSLRFSSATTMFSSTLIGQLPQGYKANGETGGPGWPGFPAYFGAGGVVSTPADMMIWLRYNMGLTGPSNMLSLLPILQQPSTSVRTPNSSQLGLSWFISTVLTASGSLDIVWKNGALAGFNSYIAFVPSAKPGVDASTAGVFLLTNCDQPGNDNLAILILSLIAGQGAVSPDVRLTPE